MKHIIDIRNSMECDLEIMDPSSFRGNETKWNIVELKFIRTDFYYNWVARCWNAGGGYYSVTSV